MDTMNAVERMGALAHPRRLAVFRLLVQAGPSGLAAGEVARAMDCPPNTLSTQLAILSRVGLVDARREGRSIIYTAGFDAVGELIGFLMQDCCGGRPEVCAPVLEAAACCAPASRVPETTGDLP